MLARTSDGYFTGNSPTNDAAALLQTLQKHQVLFHFIFQNLVIRRGFPISSGTGSLWVSCDPGWGLPPRVLCQALLLKRMQVLGQVTEPLQASFVHHRGRRELDWPAFRIPVALSVCALGCNSLWKLSLLIKWVKNE